MTRLRVKSYSMAAEETGLEYSKSLAKVYTLTSPLNIFLERIMCEELDVHEGSVSIGRRLTNFRFADDIVANAEMEEEAGVLVDRLDTTTTTYKMEVGPDKRKVITNNSNGFQREIKIKGQRLEAVESFMYLGTTISNEGSKPEILSRIAQTATALSRLKTIWRDKNISLACKVKLTRTLILSTFLYRCLWELDIDSRTRKKDPSTAFWILFVTCSLSEMFKSLL